MISPESMAYCFKCNSPVEYELNKKISRGAECPKCKTGLKCCKMCVFFDLTSYNECKEPVAERIVEKEKANFCDYFMMQVGERKLQNKNEILSKALDLFKK